MDRAALTQLPSTALPAARPEPVLVEPPLSPRARALAIVLARALQLVVDGLREYAGLPKRE